MFYSQFILAKKGPLGTIWIAAHLERKLRKNQVADTDIGVSVDSILSPDVPIALRLSSHLLLGVVRIYNKKVNYLFDDCSETLLKVKQAFRSTAVDLPPEEAKAPYSSITLPETFDLDDFELPETFQGNFVDHHVSTKEQITLQDTMDGVVYTTSQFGIDERFGDGEASQIGLDLDEELLLNKGTSSGHGVLLNSCVDSKTSFESSSTQKGQGVDEEIHEASEAVATNCSIEAPPTPGLVEGLNQEPYICDDYMEEDHEPTQLTAQDIYVSASANVQDGIHQDVLQENICDLGNQKFDKSMSQAASASFTEPNDHIDSLNTAHLSGSIQVIQASEGPYFGCAQNEICSKTESNGALGVSGEALEIGLDETIVSSNEKPSANGFFAVSEIPSFVDKSSTEPVIDAQGKHLIESFPEKEDAIIPEPSKMPVVDDARVDTLHGSQPVLLPCNLRNYDENVELDNIKISMNLPFKEFGVVSDRMSGEDVTNFLVAKEKTGNPDLNLNEEQLPNAALFSELFGQSDLSKNVELPEINISTASVLASPEKMLSLPYEPVRQSNELFVGITPEREVAVQEDQNTTVHNFSGRKRSFTESTMTLQSLKSVESSEATQFKRIADSVPDEDDFLLSSILVGRGSTILKVNSTPPASQLPSSKRRRNTRSVANKRKILVDDSTVLHGDVIRQQLQNTEDMRRVRKKAPSTPSEIWILQKQLLGTEIFNEPIFTGMSAELNSLHSHPFDLRETKLFEDEVSKRQSIKPALGEESDFVGTSEQLVTEDENARQAAVCTSNQSNVKDSTDICGNALQNERTSDGVVGHAPSLDESEIRTEVPLTSAEPSLLTFNNESITVEDRTLEDSSADKAEFPEPNIRYDDRGEPLDLERVDLDIEASIPAGGELGTQNPEHLTVHNDVKFDDTVPLLDHEREDLDNQSSNPVARDLDTENTEHEMLNSSEFLDFDLQNYGSSLLDHHEREDLNIESLKPVGEDLVRDNAVTGDDQFVESQIFADATAIDSDYPTHESPNDLEEDGIEHDTDFLNFDDDDDDENAQEDDNNMANAEGPQILDNSGWSTRTRAVANYLQVMFQKEAQIGRTDLHLDTILAKKTRKEASRMFFETLVLKTRDYIHVEQPIPFGNVSIKPRARLLNSDF